LHVPVSPPDHEHVNPGIDVFGQKRELIVTVVKLIGAAVEEDLLVVVTLFPDDAIVSVQSLLTPSLKQDRR
jgi:hypothetical protein